MSSKKKAKKKEVAPRSATSLPPLQGEGTGTAGGASRATIEPSFFAVFYGGAAGKYRNRGMTAISAWVFAVCGVGRRAYRRVL